MSEKENIENKNSEEDKKENKENDEIKENNINQIIINDFIGAQDDENNEKKININMNIPEENKIEIKNVPKCFKSFFNKFFLLFNISFRLTN